MRDRVAPNFGGSIVEKKRFWFPVRPARNGWGWGLPLVWQGWVTLILFFVLLIGGICILAPYGALVVITYAWALAGLLLAIFLWKGEPQRLRDDSSP
jgi:hypothetical protein